MTGEYRPKHMAASGRSDDAGPSLRGGAATSRASRRRAAQPTRLVDRPLGASGPLPAQRTGAFDAISPEAQMTGSLSLAAELAALDARERAALDEAMSGPVQAPDRSAALPGDTASLESPALAGQREVPKATYIWNTASGLLMAFQSVIMLMVVTHVCDMVTAGVLTLAYANANLFLNVGKYGMRNFQVSDVEPVYSFRTYAKSRVVTVAAMLVTGLAYLSWSAVTVGYAPDKTLAIAVMLLFKAVDAAEDVLHGNYQQYGHLDAGAKVLTVRLVTTIALFGAGVAFTKSLLPGLVVSTVYTTLFFVGETLWVRSRYGLPVAGRTGKRGVWSLLKSSFPVFLALFLLFYIGNAPKYAIDAAMDDAAQAYYGFIAMPVFVVGLLANFVYNPIIASLAQNWAEGKVGPFARRFALQVGIIAGITGVCIAGAWLIGVPVLDKLYNAHLAPYKLDLLILLVGGGFLAATTLFTTGITIIRCQDRLIWGYLVVAVIAAVTSPMAVGAAGIRGASLIYLALMALLTLWFLTVFTLGVRRGARRYAAGRVSRYG